MDINLYDLGTKVGAAAVTKNDAVEAEARSGWQNKEL
jgi:hypothetical protein